MYVLIERERLPEGRHYERMPDGRCIVSGREAKMFGSLDGVTLVPDAATLNTLRTKMLAEKSSGEETVADMDNEENVQEESQAAVAQDGAPQEDESHEDETAGTESEPSDDETEDDSPEDNGEQGEEGGSV